MDTGSPKIALDQVQNLHPNSNNLNITNITTTKGGKDAVVAVNFKKLKEKGEERMRAIRERMVELDLLMEEGRDCRVASFLAMTLLDRRDACPTILMLDGIASSLSFLAMTEWFLQ